MYKVLKGWKNPSPEDDLINSNYQYKMERMAGFEDLEEKVIIEWNNPISWHQWIKNDMQVIEVQRGLADRPFTDYLTFILDYKDLKEIIKNEYPEWKKMLSVTKGIYLIQDTKTGKLYVGSAYGENGIWGRWCTYVKTNGHGNNKRLKELMEQNAAYANKFRFSLLMLIPKTATDDDVISMKQLFKRKLGSNAYGLNEN